jgi:predicted phage baseplate assembly protein
MEFVQPAVHIFDNSGNLWKPKRDLIFSGPSSMELVVEADDDGYANIRFGNGIYGARPKGGTKFYATYRVGNGLVGNIGAEALQHIVSDDGRIIEVCNPMPARGGREPESMDEVRQNAPVAFRTQERAVTTDDYEDIAGRYSQVQKAAATLRWTGSWHTVFLTVDRLEGRDVKEDFKKDMIRHVERYRMAGHDLEVDGPRFVSLELEMTVCVLPEYFRSDVLSALLQVFSNRILPDGRRGVFHPDNFTFGQTVYLSRLYAVAQSVAGVAWVKITKFQRKDFPGNGALAADKLELGRLEIARLDNDPNYPENGVFILTPEGGK